MTFINLKEIEEIELLPGHYVRFVHGQTMTVAYFDIQAGAELPEHTHVHEQVSTVIEGEFELTLEQETKMLTPGMTAVIPSQARHSGRALTNCRVIDVFHPVREDYLTINSREGESE